MNIFGYCRVSGKSQVDGDGFPRQALAITGFCVTHALGQPQFREEAAVSGTVEAEDREQLAAILAEAQPGDCIVVERLDRIARDLMVQELIFRECRNRQLKVYATDQGQLIDQASNGGDPTRILIRQIMGALSQWERTMLVLKLKKARDRVREQTGRCGGVLPYGSTAVEAGNMVAINNLRDLGCSFSQIAGRLNADGRTTRHGKKWNKSNVHTVVSQRRLRKAKLCEEVIHSILSEPATAPVQ